MRGFAWGRLGENEVSIASRSAWRFMWRGHDALFIRAGRLRVRIMKPRRSS